MRKNLTAIALTITTAMALSGCTSEPAPTPYEVPTPTQPTLTQQNEPDVPDLTDEEALAIAVETYEEYLAIGGEVIATGGETAYKYDAITTSNMAEANAGTIESAQSDEFTVEGQIPVVKSELRTQDGFRIEVYLCTDLSESRVYASDGTPVGGEREGLLQPLDVAVVFENATYKVDRSEQWDQADFCSE